MEAAPLWAGTLVPDESGAAALIAKPTGIWFTQSTMLPVCGEQHCAGNAEDSGITGEKVQVTSGDASPEAPEQAH